MNCVYRDGSALMRISQQQIPKIPRFIDIKLFYWVAEGNVFCKIYENCGNTFCND